MPLHRKHPTVDGLERLDQAVGRVARRHQPGAQRCDALVVRRRHDDPARVMCGVDSAICCQGNRVPTEQLAGRHAPVRDFAWYQVDLEIATPKYVQYLRSTTDAEHRQAGVLCPRRQGEVEFVLLVVDVVHRIGSGLSVPLRVDIAATGQHESTDAGQCDERVVDHQRGKSGIGDQIDNPVEELIRRDDSWVVSQ
ncbi:hypothetical protein TL10_10210 [Mycolicibacterium llatzerense]|uniref:Uncharacterized protein n=1 Tax=Mycolicibacterium llatzerense TaxID=280871 RepID=A0A0D1LMP1_9MYCO|nr:hypothetical protein TL10_10210 [Mycolicibacterium llatzerense]